MEITFQPLQQQNTWWFREELILEDEKISDFEQVSLTALKGPPMIGLMLCCSACGHSDFNVIGHAVF